MADPQEQTKPTTGAVILDRDGARKLMSQLTEGLSLGGAVFFVMTITDDPAVIQLLFDTNHQLGAPRPDYDWSFTGDVFLSALMTDPRNN